MSEAWEKLVGGLVVVTTKNASMETVNRGPRLIQKCEFGFGAELNTPGYYEMIDLKLACDPQWLAIPIPKGS